MEATRSASVSLDSEIMDCIEKAEAVSLGRDKYDLIFDVYTKYLRQSNLRYDPDSTLFHRERNLLNQPSDQACSVNCRALSDALLQLFQKNGLQEVQVHRFHEQDRTLKMQSNLMKCFDKEEDKIWRTGYAFFSNHFVVRRVDDRCFDPTFCCTYDYQKAPIYPVTDVDRFNTNPDSDLREFMNGTVSF